MFPDAINIAEDKKREKTRTAADARQLRPTPPGTEESHR